MPAVLDLVEMGFGDELDPKGWKMLRQMRQIYQPSGLARAVYGSVTETDGFVCDKDGEIVGNLSLRYAHPRSSRGRLVGNVVVHPDHRGFGIGRALLEHAIEAARREQATWIGLEVRADNEVACQLYQHLGFHEVGTTEHMLRPEGSNWPEQPKPDRSWRRSRPQDSTRWNQLATRIHSHDQRLILEIRKDLYAFGGVERWLDRLFGRQLEIAWAHPGHEHEIDLAAHIQTDRKNRFHIWDVLMQPGLGASGAQELVAQCVVATRRFPPWPVVAIVADQRQLVDRLTAVGFRPHRTLQQMICRL